MLPASNALEIVSAMRPFLRKIVKSPPLIVRGRRSGKPHEPQSRLASRAPLAHGTSRIREQAMFQQFALSFASILMIGSSPAATQAPPEPAPAQKSPEPSAGRLGKIAAAIAHPRRTPANVARDRYRNPESQSGTARESIRRLPPATAVNFAFRNLGDDAHRTRPTQTGAPRPAAAPDKTGRSSPKALRPFCG